MKRDETLIVGLSTGLTVAEAARQAGMSERTAWRRLQDPRFVDRVRHARRDGFQQAVGILQTTSIKAARVLSGLLDCEAPAIRLAAARAVLENAAKLGEMVELDERVAALESRGAA